MAVTSRTILINILRNTKVASIKNPNSIEIIIHEKKQDLQRKEKSTEADPELTGVRSSSCNKLKHLLQLRVI